MCVCTNEYVVCIYMCTCIDGVQMDRYSILKTFIYFSLFPKQQLR